MAKTTLRDNPTKAGSAETASRTEATATATTNPTGTNAFPRRRHG